MKVIKLTALFVGLLFVVVGARELKKLDYTITINQTHCYITEIPTGKKYKVKHKELNNFFLKVNE